MSYCKTKSLYYTWWNFEFQKSKDEFHLSTLMRKERRNLRKSEFFSYPLIYFFFILISLFSCSLTLFKFSIRKIVYLLTVNLR
jgi:hypothetical protein